MRTKSMLQMLSMLLCSATAYTQSPSQPSPAVNTATSATPASKPAKKDLYNTWMGAEVFVGYHAKEKAALNPWMKLYPGKGYLDGAIGSNYDRPTATMLSLVGANNAEVPLPAHGRRSFHRGTGDRNISWKGMALAGENSSTIAPAGLKEIKVPVGPGIGFGEGFDADTILVRLTVLKGDFGVERIVLVPFTSLEIMTNADGTIIKNQHGKTLFLDPTKDERYYADDSLFGLGLHQTPKWHMEDIAGGFSGTVLTLEKPLEPGHYAVLDPASEFVWDFDVVAP